MDNSVCSKCEEIKNLIIDAYNIHEEYKNALNTIIEKNKIILEQAKIISELKKNNF